MTAALNLHGRTLGFSPSSSHPPSSSRPPTSGSSSPAQRPHRPTIQTHYHHRQIQKMGSGRGSPSGRGVQRRVSSPLASSSTTASACHSQDHSPNDSSVTSPLSGSRSASRKSSVVVSSSSSSSSGSRSSSSSASDDESGNDTDSTTDDTDDPRITFGHPLTRMIRFGSSSASGVGLGASLATDSRASSSSLSLFRGSSPESDVDSDQFYSAGEGESDGESSCSSDSSLDFAWDSWKRDFEKILDELQAQQPSPLLQRGTRSDTDARNLYIPIPPSSPTSKDSLMLRHFILPSSSSSSAHSQPARQPTSPDPSQRHLQPDRDRGTHTPPEQISRSPSLGSSSGRGQPNLELVLLLQLNHRDAREDPWNCVPHVVKAIERERGSRAFGMGAPPSVVSGTGSNDGDGAVVEIDLGETDLKGKRVESVVEDGVDVFLFMEGLREWDDPPLKTVHNYIDLFRQILEGMSFLHEHNVALRAFTSPQTLGLKVDIGFSEAGSNPELAQLPAGLNLDFEPTSLIQYIPFTSSPSSSIPEPQSASPPHSNPQYPPALSTKPPSPTFDRTLYPVKYYLTNLSKAVQILPSRDGESTGGAGGMSSRDKEVFRKDVKDCGDLIESLLVKVPRIAPKIQTLVKAMKSGEFGAEDARKLFEAMCRSLEAGVFEEPAGPTQAHSLV